MTRCACADRDGGSREGTMDQAEIQRKLDAFERSSRTEMNRIPDKRDATGRIMHVPSAFSMENIRTRDYVVAKGSARKPLYTIVHGVMLSIGEVLPGRAPIEAIDRPESLVDEFQYARLADIDDAGLAKAAIPEQPWSSDYWPVYRGLLGRRYADPKFPGSRDWKKNYEYIKANPFLEIARRGDPKAIDLLAPSEKYDLLVGDGNGSLTVAMWNEGKWYHENKGEVETWLGICDGWAAASYMLPRPRKVVTVLAADGKTELRFYPDDIKALASLLWTKARTPTRFIGARTNEKKPKVDANGRVISTEAFNTNPGTFHLVVVNQIGVSKRSFIMDATYDYEVWNQPIVSYEYRYFNPQRMKPAPDLQSAMVSREAFTKDRFRKYRDEGAKVFVGVHMRVRYIGETQPSHAKTDDPERDAVVSVDYTYDLELDATGRILGGEWYVNPHPDFLWTPPPGAQAVTPADAFAKGEWDPTKPLPESWQKAAWRASPNMLPLAKIVERLIQLANA
jgi:hypothetical protein